MTRDQFVRAATRALRNVQGHSPEIQAEAVAQMMDLLYDVTGEGASQGFTQSAAASQRTAAPAFPPIAPAALAPAPPPAYDPGAMDNLIVPATSIPSQVERAAPPRSAEPRDMLTSDNPAGMKVEHLSALVQERTPPTMEIEVQLDDRPTSKRRLTFDRNVISMHAYGAVKLSYFPRNADSISAREVSEVSVDINIEDLPYDLHGALKKLKAQAEDYLRPRSIREAPVPPVPSSPVQTAREYETGGSSMATGSDMGNTQNAFRSMS